VGNENERRIVGVKEAEEREARLVFLTRARVRMLIGRMAEVKARHPEWKASKVKTLVYA